jgi:TonB family protein
MQRSRHSTTALTILLTLAFSMLIHLVLWPLGDRLLALDWGGPPIPLGSGVIEVALMGAEDQEETEQDRLEEERERIEKQDPRGKLVNLDRLVDERRPKETEFVSEFDNRVDHQTRAPNQRPQAGAAPITPGTPDASGRTQPSDEEMPKTPSESRALALGERSGASSDGEGAEADAIPLSETPDGAMPRDPGAAGGPATAGLRGMSDAMRRTFGAPGSFDDIRDIDEGAENLLNSRRWKYASFFNRVRDAVAQHWHPEVVHAARDPDGRIYGTKTRITRLLIRLDPHGNLRGIRLDRPSGVDYLDEEAIRAVRTAQPFHNPPSQLVDPTTGFIDFGFGFIFEIHGAPRIFRYRE